MIMNITKIECCDITINPARGCSHCSPGCAHCYAERFAARMVKHPNPKISGKYRGVVDEHGKWTGKISSFDLSIFHKLPKKPKRIFVGCMTDLFHEGTPFEDLRHAWKQMAFLSRHTFMILTKRAKRMSDFFKDYKFVPPKNIWLGVTVCNQEEADEKIPLLLQTPAAVRFVSIEPMLGPVEIGKYLMEQHHHCPPIDWVICGGETGPVARPMRPDWVRSLRDQCQSEGVPYFFKGWGEWVTENQSPEDIVLPSHSKIPRGWKGRKYEDSVYRVGKRRAGRLLDGREWNEVPEVSC